MSEWGVATPSVPQPLALSGVMLSGFAEGCTADDRIAGRTVLE